ncbi:hypothetical protein GCM10009665_75160 [Kitasatospora nipponensis]|uniref:Peptidase S1 domain-containing protein n=1 Tax=Kitasatospora nipponensis TaxID=258049 RepID=A0ABP4DQL3_9ACTN
MALAASGLAGWSAMVPATAAEATGTTAVEDFGYPGAAQILADRGITLKSGDGHIVLADCASGSNLVQLFSRTATPSEVCFQVTGPTGYLALEIPQVYNIKGDDHAIKATLNTAGTVTSVDVPKNTWTPVGEGNTAGAATLLQLNATDGPAAPAPAGAYPAIGTLTIGQAGDAGYRACTATLIAPQWVLSADSCYASDGTLTAQQIRSRRTTATIGGHTLAVTGLVSRGDRDVVLGRLASPIVDIAPAGIAGAAATVGQSVKTGGFGRTATDWVPTTAHAGDATVTAVDATTVTLTPTAGTVCKGDAGGPTFTAATGGGLVVSSIHSLSGQAGCLGESSTANQVSDTRVDDLGAWIAANTPRGQRTSSDFNGDNKTDLALTGGANWPCLPVALSKGDATFNTSCNVPGGSWGYWASTAGVKRVTGDFNGDGRTDLALTGGANWDCLPVALSKGDGTFDVSCNTPGGSWGYWASTAGVKVVTGDFNGDGRTDLALTGGANWDCLPVALSKGDGTFDVSCNAPGGYWGNWVNESGVKLLTGDFNADGRTDLALTGGAGWDCLPVLLSNGNGTFNESCNAPGGSWGYWASTAGVKAVTGDFNGDGRTDVVLTGGANWDCLPMALSNGNGTFNVSCNTPGGSWGYWASTAGVKVVTGDFNGDGRADLALTGGANWDCLPVALSKGDGTFTVSCNAPGGYWGNWVNDSGAKLLTGDYDGDGRTDLALTGGAGWDCLPVLLSNGNGTFKESCNSPGSDWSSRAGQPGVTVL